MFKSPKRGALYTCVAGFGLGILLAFLADHRGVNLRILPALFAGLILGMVLFVSWQRKQSKTLLICGYLVIWFLSAIATALGRGLEAMCVAGAFGLAQWVEIQIWERRHKGTITWQGAKVGEKE
jgi:hypothetical protein